MVNPTPVDGEEVAVATPGLFHAVATLIDAGSIATIATFPVPKVTLTTLPATRHFVTSVAKLAVFHAVYEPAVTPEEIFGPRFATASGDSTVFMDVSSFSG